MNKKDLLAEVLFGYMGKVVSYTISKLRRNHRLYVLSYHRINNIPDGIFSCNPDLISASPDDFVKQVKFISENYKVVTLQQLSVIINTGAEITEDLVLFTFDDGHMDNYTYAHEILSGFGLKAVYFITTDNIEKQQAYWFDKVVYLFNRFDSLSINLDSVNYSLSYTLETKTTKRREFFSFLRSLSLEKFKKFQLELFFEHKDKFDDFNFEVDCPVLQWKHIQSMSHDGFEIGSHTCSHPFLSNLTNDEISKELSISKKIIEEKIKKNVISICYPSGDYDMRVKTIAESVGYEFGFSYKHSSSNIKTVDNYEIPRIHVESYTTDSMFKANLILPEVFLLK